MLQTCACVMCVHVVLRVVLSCAVLRDRYRVPELIPLAQLVASAPRHAVRLEEIAHLLVTQALLLLRVVVWAKHENEEKGSKRCAGESGHTAKMGSQGGESCVSVCEWRCM